MNRKTLRVRPERRLKDVAKREIARHGLHGVEVRHLAKRAKTSTSVFYEFYSCRDQLLEEIFDDGWSVIEQHISQRLMLTSDLEEILVGIVEATLDALEADPDSVGAALVLGYVTVGQSVRERLRLTPAFQRYHALQAKIACRVAATTGMSEDDRDWTFEFLFGGVTRVLFLSTPLCNRTRQRQVDKQAVVNSVRRMIVGGLLGGASGVTVERGSAESE